MKQTRLLLDANISPETAMFLRSLGFDVESLIEEGLGGLDDVAVVERARKTRRVLITFDLDFGELYYFSARRAFSIIILRLDDQRVENVNVALQKFFVKYRRLFGGKKKRLAVVSDSDLRIVE
ncbi:DUF5615 family PIN-like protein [Candidatus Parcubacteria bacterium]|nr:DUF5615 family PIN-like protein [Candidatus Parcubacteria bacterium]